MKVSELIEKLQQMPQDVEVVMAQYDACDGTIFEVELCPIVELHYRPKVGGEYKVVASHSDLPEEVKKNIGDWKLVWRESKTKQEVRLS